MNEIIKTRPKFTLYCECFHFEGEEYEETDPEGNRVIKTRMVKKESHIENYSFPYYCCRDVSGLFVFKYRQSSLSKKDFYCIGP